MGKAPPFLSVFASGESPMMLADRPAAVPAGSGRLAGSRNLEIFFLCSSQSSSDDGLQSCTKEKSKMDEARQRALSRSRKKRIQDSKRWSAQGKFRNTKKNTTVQKFQNLRPWNERFIYDDRESSLPLRKSCPKSAPNVGRSMQKQTNIATIVTTGDVSTSLFDDILKSEATFGAKTMTNKQETNEMVNM